MLKVEQNNELPEKEAPCIYNMGLLDECVLKGGICPNTPCYSQIKDLEKLVLSSAFNNKKYSFRRLYIPSEKRTFYNIHDEAKNVPVPDFRNSTHFLFHLVEVGEKVEVYGPFAIKKKLLPHLLWDLEEFGYKEKGFEYLQEVECKLVTLEEKKRARRRQAKL